MKSVAQSNVQRQGLKDQKDQSKLANTHDSRIKNGQSKIITINQRVKTINDDNQDSNRTQNRTTQKHSSQLHSPTNYGKKEIDRSIEKNHNLQTNLGNDKNIQSPKQKQIPIKPRPNSPQPLPMPNKIILYNASPPQVNLNNQNKLLQKFNSVVDKSIKKPKQELNDSIQVILNKQEEEIQDQISQIDKRIESIKYDNSSNSSKFQQYNRISSLENELSKTVNFLREENDRLRDRISQDLQPMDRNHHYQKDENELIKTVNFLREENERLRDRSTQDYAPIDKHSLKDQYDQSQTIKILIQENERLKDRTDTQNSVPIEKQKYSSKDQNELSEINNQLREENERLKNRISNQSYVPENQQQLKDLNERLSQQIQENKFLIYSNKHLSDENSQIKGKFALMEVEQDDLQTLLQKMRKELDSYHSQTKKVQPQSNTNNLKQDTDKPGIQRSDEKEKEFKILQIQLIDQQSRNQLLQQQNDQLKKYIEDFQQDSNTDDQLIFQVVELEAKLKDCLEEIDNLQKANFQLKQENHISQKVINTIKEDKEIAISDVAHHVKQMENLGKELIRTRQQLANNLNGSDLSVSDLSEKKKNSK